MGFSEMDRGIQLGQRTAIEEERSKLLIK